MRKRLVLSIVGLSVASAGVVLVLTLSSPPAVSGQVGGAGGPQIVLYTGANFTGRSVSVTGTLFDLPADKEPGVPPPEILAIF